MNAASGSFRTLASCLAIYGSSVVPNSRFLFEVAALEEGDEDGRGQ